jgi:hypothetical protein
VISEIGREAHLKKEAEGEKFKAFIMEDIVLSLKGSLLLPNQLSNGGA